MRQLDVGELFRRDLFGSDSFLSNPFLLKDLVVHKSPAQSPAGKLLDTSWARVRRALGTSSTRLRRVPAEPLARPGHVLGPRGLKQIGCRVGCCAMLVVLFVH